MDIVILDHIGSHKQREKRDRHTVNEDICVNSVATECEKVAVWDYSPSNFLISKTLNMLTGYSRSYNPKKATFLRSV